jgi:hypothetical protein
VRGRPRWEARERMESQ